MRYFSYGSLFAGLLMILFTTVAAAQSASELYIYPLKKQSTAQQDKDRYECHRWAVQQTGYDPSRATPAQYAASDTPSARQPSQPHVLRGAARGTALGAVGGAIAGNAGKGAAAGAAIGGLGGAFRKMDEKRHQANYQQAQTTSAAMSQRTNYNRAMAACLEGRGYSVK